MAKNNEQSISSNIVLCVFLEIIQQSLKFVLIFSQAGSPIRNVE